MPFFGICLGLQLAIIEFARSKAGIADATSEEFEVAGTSVIHYMQGQQKEGPKGGNMRLGAYACSLKKDSVAHSIYGMTQISERHRHRLEVNNDYIEKLVQNGLVVSGMNNDLNLVEVIELPRHPFFVACQYHPEFKSKPFSPHPIFSRFIQAAINDQRK